MTSLPLLVDVAWLADYRRTGDFKIIDVTAFMIEPEGDGYYDLASGARTYAQAHIPGAVFADLITEFSDTGAPDPLTALAPEEFADRMGALGIGDGDRVIIYDQGVGMWATRLWWNLRLEGFDDVAILDGGFAAWQAAGLPVASGTETLPATIFTARRRPELLAVKEEVLAAVHAPGIQLLNALDSASFEGRRKTYARRGRIPSSTHVYYGDLITEWAEARSRHEVRPLFAAAGVLDEDTQVVVYCGSGVASTYVAFQLARLGRHDVAVYDGSLTEWAADHSLPMETGPEPGVAAA